MTYQRIYTVNVFVLFLLVFFFKKFMSINAFILLTQNLDLNAHSRYEKLFTVYMCTHYFSHFLYSKITRYWVLQYTDRKVPHVRAPDVAYIFYKAVAWFLLQPRSYVHMSRLSKGSPRILDKYHITPTWSKFHSFGDARIIKNNHES